MPLRVAARRLEECREFARVRSSPAPAPLCEDRWPLSAPTDGAGMRVQARGDGPSCWVGESVAPPGDLAGGRDDLPPKTEPVGKTRGGGHARERRERARPAPGSPAVFEAAMAAIRPPHALAVDVQPDWELARRKGENVFANLTLGPWARAGAVVPRPLTGAPAPAPPQRVAPHFSPSIRTTPTPWRARNAPSSPSAPLPRWVAAVPECAALPRLHPRLRGHCPGPGSNAHRGPPWGLGPPGTVRVAASAAERTRGAAARAARPSHGP